MLKIMDKCPSKKREREEKKRIKIAHVFLQLFPSSYERNVFKEQ
jgi:hypothetical protein